MRTTLQEVIIAHCFGNGPETQYYAETRVNKDGTSYVEKKAK